MARGDGSKVVVMACGTCGSEVRRYRSEVRRGTASRAFCSPACFQAAGGLKPKTGWYVPCKRCGADIWVTPAQPRVYCGKACHDASQTKPKITRECETCGETFTLNRTAAANAHKWGRFCSYDCMGVSKRKRPLDRMHNGKPALLNRDGYVLVWEPERRAGKATRYMLEHRLAVEVLIGRPLLPEEHIDHINGDKQDNRPENLRIVDPSTHGKITNATQAARRLALEAELAEYRRRYGILRD